MNENVLISPQELLSEIDSENLVIVDTRTEEEYQKGHIKGAVNIRSIFTYLATAEAGGLEALQSTFATLLGEAGISGTEHIVIYEDALNNGYGQSCRGYFLLKYLGHPNVSVLHGGLKAWTDLGYPITNEIRTIEKKEFTPKLDNSVMVTKEQMKEALDDNSIIKLDCRDKDEWIGLSSSPYGADFCPRKGRIPGAVWMEWYKMMEQSSGIPMFIKDAEILSICEDLGIKKDSTVYIYCFKGSRASNTMIALKKAGIKDVRNYFASWNEWSRDFSLPIDDKILE